MLGREHLALCYVSAAVSRLTLVGPLREADGRATGSGSPRPPGVSRVWPTSPQWEEHCGREVFVLSQLSQLYRGARDKKHSSPVGPGQAARSLQG